jgi:hypothetical protein
MPPHARQRRLGEGVEVKHEADEGGAVVFVAVELWRIHGEDRKLIMDDPIYLARLEPIFDGLRKAGLPEQ